jgi:hypothetical protein
MDALTVLSTLKTLTEWMICGKHNEHLKIKGSEGPLSRRQFLEEMDNRLKTGFETGNRRPEARKHVRLLTKNSLSFHLNGL